MPVMTPDFRIEQSGADKITAHFDEENRIRMLSSNVKIDLSLVTAVSVKHLDEVASHAINTIFGSRSHVIEFTNGSILQYAYNSAGELIELSGNNLACSLSSDNVLLFYLF